jgi:hypothetical protein
VRDLRGLSKRATEAHWRSTIEMPQLVDTDSVLEQRARGAATVTRGLPRFLR